MINRLLIFARVPVAGRTKTRLIPALGPAGAADLHRRMIQQTLRRVSGCRAVIEVRFTGGGQTAMAPLCQGARSFCDQGDGDLGDRLMRAFGSHFSDRAHRVVAIGTDCPQMSAARVNAALSMLDEHQLVLGPAADGGYYLIGLSAAAPQLFERMDWGTDQVFNQTLDTAKRLRLSVGLLPQLSDVDRPEDLNIWKTCNDRISIIIPTLNEAACIESTLNAARRGDDVELIVVDGGSRDQTTSLAQSLGARIVTGTRGRASQMNAGVAVSDGGLLLFCHADTLVPTGFDSLVRRTLADTNVAVGAFRLCIDSESPQPGFRLIERFVRFRSERLKHPYGDQALFMRRSMFKKLGGYVNMPVMEDYDLIRRAGRLGAIRTVNAPVITSPRLWQTRGITRTTIIHQCIIGGYHAGLSPHRLAQWRSTRSPQP